MAKQTKKQQLQIKKDLEKQINKIDLKNTKQFESTTNEINKLVESLYDNFNLSKETIQTLRQNPKFALGISNISKKTDKEIKALFLNYKDALNNNVTKSFNTGLASRVWESEVSTSILFGIERQPLPFVKALLQNKKILGFDLGDRINSVEGETLKKVKDFIESSLLNGNDIKTTTLGIRDIVGYSPNGKRLKGGLAKATRISRTEMRRAFTTGQHEAQQELNELGIETTELWRATLDRRTRVYHLAADSQIKGSVIEDAFLVGGQRMRYPLDPLGSASNVVNCRCYVEYTSEPLRDTTRVVREKEHFIDANGRKRKVLPKPLQDASWKKWKKTRLKQMNINTSF